MKNRSLLYHVRIYLLLWMLSTCILGIVLLSYSNYRYRRSIVCLYGTVCTQVDSNTYMSGLLDSCTNSEDLYARGLAAMQSQGYGTLLLPQIRIWEKVDYMLTLGLLLGAGTLLYLVFFRRINRQWQVDREKIRDSVKGILSGECEVGSWGSFDDSAEICALLRKLSDWNRQRTLELEAGSRQVMEILEDIAHQMKTPLAGIQMYLELLLAVEDNDKKQQKLEDCHSAVEALEQMVFRILRMARLDSERVTMTLENADLNDILTESIANNRYLQTKKNITIRRISHISGIVACDRFWTGEAIGNVLNNALAFTADQGEILCEITQDGSVLSLQIKNRGYVIPMTEYSNLFQRFYHHEKNRGGDGIGLHLAARTMEMQGGILRILPLSDGNCFEFRFHESMGKTKKGENDL